jgi:hypothetical protein
VIEISLYGVILLTIFFILIIVTGVLDTRYKKLEDKEKELEINLRKEK